MRMTAADALNLLSLARVSNRAGSAVGTTRPTRHDQPSAHPALASDAPLAPFAIDDTDNCQAGLPEPCIGPHLPHIAIGKTPANCKEINLFFAIGADETMWHFGRRVFEKKPALRITNLGQL